ncbi:MAG: hypothetical protein K2X38_11300 [Gemmataceae bacterium]|nr:hypothetical protein [Gemmataceae bacterium]
MAKKPDLSKVKSFLFDKGEKLGLGVCLAIMALLVGLGAMSAMGQSASAHVTTLKSTANGIRSKVQTAQPSEEDLTIKVDVTSGKEPWPMRLSTFAVTPFTYLPDVPKKKRMNPPVLPVRPALAGEDAMKIDYVRGLYFAYEIDTAKNGLTIVSEAKEGAGAVGQPPMGPGIGGMAGAKGSVKPAVIAKPIRMNIVSATFPLKDQVTLYAQSLNMSLSDLFSPMNRDLLPKFQGINVERCEVMADGKTTPWTRILATDPVKNKIEMSKAIKEVLRETIYDTTSIQEYAMYVHPGLVSPLPQLAFGKYPKAGLKGIEPAPVDELAGGPMGEPGKKIMPAPGVGMPGVGMPGVGMPGVKFPGVGNNPNPGGAPAAGPELAFANMGWNKLPRDMKPLKDKLEGNIYPFDPFGIAPEADDKKLSPGFVPGMQMPPAMPGGGEGGPGGAANQPGKGILAPWDLFEERAPKGEAEGPGPGVMNPGIGMAGQQRKLILQDALVRFFDPDVQPGKTYRYRIQVRLSNPNYGKKQHVAFAALADIKDLAPSDWQITPDATIPGEHYFYAVDQMPTQRLQGGSNYEQSKGETVALQIHRWIDQFTDPQGLFHIIGDWAIAERLLVRRGEPIGRLSVMVELPEWSKAKQSFEIKYSAPPQLKKLPASQKDLARSGIPVDFQVTFPPPMLVDFDGGKQEHRFVTLPGYPYVKDESAVDVLILNPNGKLIVRNSRIDGNAELPAGKERQERVARLQERVQDAKNSGMAAPAGGPGTGPAMPRGN